MRFAFIPLLFLLAMSIILAQETTTTTIGGGGGVACPISPTSCPPGYEFGPGPVIKDCPDVSVCQPKLGTTTYSPTTTFPTHTTTLSETTTITPIGTVTPVTTTPSPTSTPSPPQGEVCTTCPAGYIAKENWCDPACLYSTPPCAIPSIACPSATTTTTYACPAIYQPVCGVDGRTYSNSCEAGSVSIAHEGECSTATATTLPPTLPPGCFEETDPTGIVRVVCKRECEPIPEELSRECSEHGGIPKLLADPSGCNYLSCEFPTQPAVTNPIVGLTECPSGEEIKDAIDSCYSSGNKGVVSFEGGCQVVQCIQEERPVCNPISEENRRQIEQSCNQQNLNVIIERDANDCEFLRCGEPNYCRRELIKDEIDRCKMQGGEIAVRKDDRGCIIFADCLHRGDERDAYIEPSKEVPDVSELLAIALQLDQLKVELDKLERSSADIANYYASVDAPDRERYERVAGMFAAAKDKIDEIKDKIRSKLDNLSLDDVNEIRHDIRYIKDVMLKDILYVMLSKSSEVRAITKERVIETEVAVGTDCGTDGRCFDRAIRICREVSFRPEGGSGPLIQVKGLQDGKCVLEVVMERGPTGSRMSMICRLANYALGVRGPEDVLPYCEGEMAELAKRYGGQGSVGGHEFPPPEGGPGGCKSISECAQYCLQNYDVCAEWTKQHPAYGTIPPRDMLEKYARGELSGGPPEVPGVCRGEDCREKCSQSPENARKCLEHLGQYLPPEAKEGLSRIASGEKFEFPGRERPTEGESCVGCLDNGVCDARECSFCSDCSRRSGG